MKPVMGNGKRKGEKKLAKKKEWKKWRGRNPIESAVKSGGGRTLVFFLSFFPAKRKKGKNFISIFLLLFFLLGIYIRRGKNKDTTFCECVIAAKVRFKKSRRQGKYFP